MYLRDASVHLYLTIDVSGKEGTCLMMDTMMSSGPITMTCAAVAPPCREKVVV